MRRWQLALMSLIVVGVAACEQKKVEPTVREEEPPPALSKIDTSTPPPETDPYATDPMMKPQTTRAREPLQPIDTGRAKSMPPAKTTKAPAAASRTHVVQKGDTLSGLAKRYYGDAGKWKKIYDANRDVLSSPNRLKVGTRLAIP